VATTIGATNALLMIYKLHVLVFYGMSTAAAYIQSGRYKKVLLIGADKMSSIVDYRSIYLYYFGDGAGAVCFEPNYEGLGLQDEYLRSDGVGRDFLKIDAGGSLNQSINQWK
jgi:3-oxoacyl-[acyl-carrier-protein] synthase-3